MEQRATAGAETEKRGESSSPSEVEEGGDAAGAGALCFMDRRGFDYRDLMPDESRRFESFECSDGSAEEDEEEQWWRDEAASEKAEDEWRRHWAEGGAKRKRGGDEDCNEAEEEEEDRRGGGGEHPAVADEDEGLRWWEKGKEGGEEQEEEQHLGRQRRGSDGVWEGCEYWDNDDADADAGWEEEGDGLSETERDENLVARTEISLEEGGHGGEDALGFAFATCGEDDSGRWRGPWTAGDELLLRTVRDAVCRAFGLPPWDPSAPADVPRWCAEVREFFGPSRFARKGKSAPPVWITGARRRVRRRMEEKAKKAEEAARKQQRRHSAPSPLVIRN